MAKQKNKQGRPVPKGKTTKRVQTQINSRKNIKTDKRLNVSSKFDIKNIIFAAILMAVTFVAFYPAVNNGLTNWDDDVYVTENRDIRALDKNRPVDKVLFNNLMTKNYVSNYHPITMLTFTIDHYFSEYTPKGTVAPKVFHRTNIIIHTINVGLVFWLVYLLIGGLDAMSGKDRKKKSWRLEIAVIASALFGLHTIHVESVAWVAERKDVLYTMFYLMSMIAYLKYVFKRNIAFLLFSILLFASALLSKAMAASMAVSLIAVDFLYKRRLLSPKVWIEKLPYFILAFAFGYYALKAQRASGALADEYIFAFYERLAFAAYGFTHYIIKLIAPVNLSAFYAYPLREAGGSIPGFYYLFLIPALAFVGLLYYAIKRSGILAFGLMFFVLNIALVLQLLPVGNAIMADRYSYVP